MSDVKFLSDGRKVAVIGQLNNQETIVQEIFVTPQGDEIPSGERFVVKSLHDAPVETYLSRQKKREEADLEKAKHNLASLNREISDARNKLAFWKDMFKQVKALADNINEQDFEHLTNVLTGQYNFVVEDSYRIPDIKGFQEAVSQIDHYCGRRDYEGVRLISVLGNSDGNLAYKLNEYRDGSGGYSTVNFFKSHKDASDYIKSLAVAQLHGSGLDIQDLKQCKSLGIEFSKDEMEKIRTKLTESSAKYLEQASDSYDKAKNKYDSDISYVDQLIESL
ncbi:hypothetical protein [Pectobacterium parmentieri]|uniref:hypothetical protein n=1 Tax=Pectobacterium parmentieri TaxID=1905730 RepID=UPI000D60CC8F|nr:hypothetical protein [Pectobacterium parmentieri]PWD66535.1 hypothetical protein DF211_01925 [Pectobacterium parmentieri]